MSRCEGEEDSYTKTASVDERKRIIGGYSWSQWVKTQNERL